MSKKELTVAAKIVGKNTFINSEDRSIHSIRIYQTNLLTFELEDGKRIVFNVEPMIYSYYIEGDEGALTYETDSQYVSFISFKRVRQ